MDALKWFDRKFDFSLSKDDYSSVNRRLSTTEARLKQLTEEVPAGILIHKPDGKWSVNEHIGHLYLLESLWRIRFDDICREKPVLTPADLENKATDEAGFNNYSAAELIKKFADERHLTLSLLSGIQEKDKVKASLHPRLQRSMRIIDLAYFIAEHDDHHVDQIMISIKNG